MDSRIAILFLVGLLPFIGAAQTPVEFADQRVSRLIYYDIEHAPDGNYAIVAYVNEENGPTNKTVLMARSPAGSEIWSTELPTNGSSTVPSGTITLPDSSVCAFGELWPCGDEGIIGGFAGRCHPDGTIAWYHEWTLSGFLSGDRSPGGDLAFGSYNKILVTNADGDSLDHWSRPPSYESSMLWETDSTLLLAGDASLDRFSRSGVLLGSVGLPEPGMDLLLYGNEILVLTTSSVIRMDSSLQAIDTLLLAAYVSDGGSLKQLLVDDDDYWVRSDEGMIHIDPLLGPIGSFAWDLLNGQFVEAAAIHDGSIMTAGLGSSWGNHMAGLMREYTPSGLTSGNDADVEISIASDTSWSDLDGIWPETFVTHYSAELHLVNHMTDPLNKVHVGLERGFGDCVVLFTSLILDSLAIAPGDTLLIPFPEITRSFDTSWYDLLNLNYCFIALSPNDLVDRDQSDNRACGSVEYVVGIHTPVEDPPFSIYPDPFEDTFIISLGAIADARTFFSLYDATGRLVSTFSVPPGSSTFSWSRHGLHDGPYWLRGTVKDRPVTRRIMKVSR